MVQLFVQVGEFALLVRVAQSVKTVGEGEVGCEAVVDEEIFESRQQAHALHRFATPLGVEMVESELVGAENVQPVTLAAESAASFVGMEDGTLHEGLADGSHGKGGFFASFFTRLASVPWLSGQSKSSPKASLRRWKGMN